MRRSAFMLRIKDGKNGEFENRLKNIDPRVIAAYLGD